MAVLKIWKPFNWSSVDRLYLLLWFAIRLDNVFWRFDGLFTSIIGPKRCTLVRLQDALGSLFLIISCFPIYMILCCKKKNCCRKIFYYDFRLARLIRKDSLWPLLRDLADSRLRRHLNLILFRIILCHLLWV